MCFLHEKVVSTKDFSVPNFDLPLEAIFAMSNDKIISRQTVPLKKGNPPQAAQPGVHKVALPPIPAVRQQTTPATPNVTQPRVTIPAPLPAPPAGVTSANASPAVEVQEIEAQERTSSEINPEFTGVIPPSAFYFYSFKELGIKQLKAIHQAKLNAAARKSSDTMVVETISSLLTCSAYDLTIPDFAWVMYWIRTESYLKVPMTHIAICTNHKHIMQVERGEKDEETLKTVSVINRTNLKETGFDAKALEDWLHTDAAKVLEGIPLSVPTIRDVIEMTGQSNREDYDEYVYLANLAGNLGHVDENGVKLSLDKRIKIVEDFLPEHVSALEEYSLLTSSYGVQESIKVKCGECGADIETVVSLSASSFL